MIHSERPFVVYKSSAGSGKTFTLTKSYLSIALSAESDDYFKTILAITFTNKAAAEMKGRILNSLKEFANGNFDGSYLFLAETLSNDLNIDLKQLQEKSKRVYSLMLHRYSDINISTIDKFVHKIVRTFAHDLNLPINFEINLEEGLLLAEAVYKLIETSEENKDLFDLLVKLAENKTDDDKSWNIELDLIKYAQDLTKEENTAYLDRISKLSIKEIENIRNELSAKVNKMHLQLKTIANKATELIKNKGLNQSDFYYGTKGIGSWFDRVSTLNFDALEKPNSYVLKTINEDIWYSDKAAPDIKSGINNIKDELKLIYNQLAEFSNNHLPVLKIINSASANLFRVAVLNEIETFFKAIRKEENVVTISEFNKRINQIVNEEPAPYIYERLGEKYHHYLIDEFQDTSILQFENFLPLIDNALAEQYNCMLVGDSKQAIYRWRGGAVEQMDTLPNLLSSDKSDYLKEREQSLKRYFELRVLENNFRSKKEIVDFNNHFFEWTQDLLANDLKKVYHLHSQKIKPGNEGGYVKINVLERKENKEEQTELHLTELKSEIDNLVEKGVPFSQMAIITRGNADLIAISEFLIANNIPVLSSESLLIKNNQKIKFIEAYLNWINLPESKLFLYEWLLFAKELNLVTSELFHHLLNSARKDYHNDIYKLTEEYIINPGYYSLSLFEMAERIINTYLSAHEPFDSYLISFLDAVHDFNNSSNGHGLTSFLNWWNEKKNKLSLSMPSSNEAIQLLTIHKSKGLEFPFVIMPFASWEIKKQYESKWVDNLTDDISLPSFIIDVKESLTNTVYESVYTEETEKSLLDNINLLYVAFTRPEQGLIILTDKREKETKDVAWILNNYLNSFSQTIPFEKGEISPIKHQTKSKELNHLHYYSRNNWQNKIKVKAGNEFDQDIVSDEIIIGQAFHSFIEFYLKNKNLEKSLIYLSAQGFATPVINIINEMFSEIITNQNVKHWLNNCTIISIEQDVISEDGTVSRPDLVIQDKDSTLIIDFKTGEPLEKHIYQVNGYKYLYERMGYANIKACLLYVNPFKLMEV